MSKLKNYWSVIMPNLLTILGILLYLIKHKLKSGILVVIVFNLYLFIGISRQKPWNRLNERGKKIARNLWTINAIWPSSIFIAVVHDVLFPFSLSLYFIAIGGIITGSVGWYLNAKGISERYVSKALENGGLLWRGDKRE